MTSDVIEGMRRAGLAPTRRRVAVAALLAGPEPVSAEDLRERALEAGFCLSAEAAERSLDEFRRAGILPPAPRPARPFRHGAARAARLLKAMGNPHRLAILRELAGGERCVGQLLAVVELSPSALSQHLARLRTDGVVRVRRQAQHLFYSLAGRDPLAVMAALPG